MRDKLLFPTTVIPKELYVNRGADRQIGRIIHSMGRPGYVLVARQMGKTNLLLNARRELQRPEDAFIYVDLSNKYMNLRECFRSIIDTAISTHEEKFLGLAERISVQRKERIALSPHREHEQELRDLLRSIKGSMVIFLDEIDALTRSDFSDELFAKIRSIYMMRDDIQEFKRLAYVLSGVAEPGELIKNKALSPFNIGEKIYLDSFTRAEFVNFLNKAKLELPEEVAERIYYWTSGNPRMIWDICSEVEDLIIENASIDAKSIDEIVHRLYLAAFDRPPVDHIRNLLTSDRELRNAITIIRYKKGMSISDSLKRRLYLYGITVPYDNSQAPVIANKIIDASISQNWIESIEAETADPMDVALQEFIQGNFAEAIRLAREHLETTSAPGLLQWDTLSLIAECQIALSNYEDAVKTIDGCHIDPNAFPIDYYMLKFLKALALWYGGRLAEGMHAFSEIMSAPVAGVRLNAVVEISFLNLPFENNIVSRETFLQSYFPVMLDSINAIEEIAREIVSMGRVGASAGLLQEQSRLWKIKAYHVIAIGFYLSGDYAKASEYHSKVLELGRVTERGLLLLNMAVIEKDQERMRQLISELCHELLESGFHVSEGNPRKPLIIDKVSLASLIYHGFKAGAGEAIEDLLNNVHLQLRWPTPIHLMIELAESVEKIGIAEQTNALYEYSAKYLDRNYRGGNNEDKLLIQIYRAMALRAEDTDRALTSIMDRYLTVFDQIITPEILAEADFSVFYRYALYLIKAGRAARVHNILGKINRLRNSVTGELRGYYVIIDFVDMLACQHEHDDQREVAIAQRILRDFPVMPAIGERLLQFSAEDVSNIRSRAQAIINQAGSMRAIRAKPIYPRNQIITVFYKEDGRTIKSKFKRVEQDIISGACIVVEEPQ